MPKEAASVKDALASLANQPAALRIHFPSTTVTEPGTKLTKAATVPEPTFSLAASVLAARAPPSGTFLGVKLDLDAPFPSFAVMSPILHAVQADLAPAAGKQADGWVPLEPGAKAVVHYAPPGPPPRSAPHRFVFLLYEQPEGLDSAKVRAAHDWPEEVGMWSRVRWDHVAFEKKLGLGKVVAANYFTV